MRQKKENDKIKLVMKNKILAKGTGASPGLVEGLVVVVRSKKEFSKMKDGRILVAPMTSPSWIMVMKKAVAVITDKGGRLSIKLHTEAEKF